MNKIKAYLQAQDLFEEEKKVLLGLSLMILLAVYFVLSFIIYIYFPESSLMPDSPGFWINLLNIFLVSLIMLLNKWTLHWSWDHLGFKKPKSWWQPILVTVLTFISLVLFSYYIQPLIGAQPTISHLMVLKDNLPLLILALVLVWTTAAFLQELVFRAFLIEALDHILGRKAWSIWIALIVSSLIFGLIHGWQGLSGVLATACIGFIFGIAYILNGKRIWPLIIVHGIADTISLISIYNM